MCLCMYVRVWVQVYIIDFQSNKSSGEYNNRKQIYKVTWNSLRVKSKNGFPHWLWDSKDSNTIEGKQRGASTTPSLSSALRKGLRTVSQYPKITLNWGICIYTLGRTGDWICKSLTRKIFAKFGSL